MVSCIKGTIFCYSFRVAIEIDTKNNYRKVDFIKDLLKIIIVKVPKQSIKTNYQT
jgi:hypothetical protein